MLKKISGFSLLETIVTLTITGIILGLGTNNFSKKREYYQGEFFMKQLQFCLRTSQIWAQDHSEIITLTIQPKELTMQTETDPTPRPILKLPIKGNLIFKNQFGYNHSVTFLPNGHLLHTRGSFYLILPHTRWRLICLETGENRLIKEF